MVWKTAKRKKFSKRKRKKTAVWITRGVEASSEAKGGKRGLVPQGIDRRSLIAGLVGGAAVGMGVITLSARHCGGFQVRQVVVMAFLLRGTMPT